MPAIVISKRKTRPTKITHNRGHNMDLYMRSLENPEEQRRPVLSVAHQICDVMKTKVFSSTNTAPCVHQVTEEKPKKTWMTVDAQTTEKDDIRRETVYCLDDDNETEVQRDDTIQGEFEVSVIMLLKPYMTE